MTRLERFVATARQPAHAETWHRLTSLITEERRAVLEALLVPAPQTGRSVLQWLRRDATAPTASPPVETLQKITGLRAMAVEPWALPGLHPNRGTGLAQLGGKAPPPPRGCGPRSCPPSMPACWRRRAPWGSSTWPM